LDCRHVCKTCAIHDALQAGKQKEVHRTPLIWRTQAPDQGSTICIFCFVCFLVTFTDLFRHTTYIYKCIYVHALTLETAEPTCFSLQQFFPYGAAA
jgi:hypothetical protein